MDYSPPSPTLISALNLSKNERAVFDALIELRMARDVSVIARTAGLSRSTTLYILRKFLLRNLVRATMAKKRRKWMYNRMLNFTNKTPNWR